MNNSTTYTRRDVTSIYEYLKEQAAELSNGRWTDFSSGDIGSILLGLMAFLADQNNFQLDKTASELFLDTALERSSIMALLKLVGYEPRHYMSARTTVELETQAESTTSTLIPAYTVFTNADGTITYQNLVPIIISNGKGTCDEVYEGTRIQATYQYSDITADGRIYLPDYKVGVNTVQVYIPSISSSLIPRVDNVKFSDGDFEFSVHVSEDSLVYIQLPSYWTDVLTVASTIRVSYLLSSGEAGRIGANILTRFISSDGLSMQFNITNPRQSVGGFFPETVDEIKISAPVHARTMDTIVTKKDLNELAMATEETALIAQVKAGDYNDTWTGYVQPADAYKCKVLAVPFNRNETSIYVQDADFNIRLTNPATGDIYWADYSTTPATIYDADYNDVTGIDISTFKKTYTDAAQELIDYIDERRLASLMFTYEDPIRVVPNIRLNLYADPTDIRTQTIAQQVRDFMVENYYRDNLAIGESLPGSVIGKDLLNKFSVLTYVEVVDPDINIACPVNGYIDMYYAKFRIFVNDVEVISEYNE